MPLKKITAFTHGKTASKPKESNGGNVRRPVCTKYSTSTVRANHGKTKLHILDQKKRYRMHQGAQDLRWDMNRWILKYLKPVETCGRVQQMTNGCAKSPEFPCVRPRSPRTCEDFF